MAACTEKVKSGRFIYFFAGRKGGFPAVQACEGTPLGEARRGVGVAVSLLAGHAVGVDASVLLYKLVVGNMPMLRSCRDLYLDCCSGVVLPKELRVPHAVPRRVRAHGRRVNDHDRAV